MMTAERYEAEYRALAGHFPARRFAFVWDRNPRLEVILPLAQFDTAYKAKIYGLEDFPQEAPIVTVGTVLRDYHGKRMSQPSRENHLLGTYNGETWLCIYAWWEPQYSLTKTAIRTATWLYAYHCHLQTGKSLECYLSH